MVWPEGAPIEAHLAALLRKLEPKRDEIGRVARRFVVQIGVAQSFHEVNPQFRIEPDYSADWLTLVCR